MSTPEIPAEVVSAAARAFYDAPDDTDVRKLGLLAMLVDYIGEAELLRMLAVAFAAGRESAYTRDEAEIEFVDWDYRDQPDWDDIDRIVAEQSGGRVHMTVVEDTGSQDCAIAITDRKLEQPEATDAYLAWVRRVWEED